MILLVLQQSTNLITVYVILVVTATCATYEGHRLCATDIKGAYLNAKLKSGNVYMKLPPYLATLGLSDHQDNIIVIEACTGGYSSMISISFLLCFDLDGFESVATPTQKN